MGEVDHVWSTLGTSSSEQLLGKQTALLRTVPSRWDAKPNLVGRFQVSTVHGKRRKPRSVERKKNVCSNNHSQARQESHQPGSCSQPDGPTSACWRLKRFGLSAEQSTAPASAGAFLWGWPHKNSGWPPTISAAGSALQSGFALQ